MLEDRQCLMSQYSEEKLPRNAIDIELLICTCFSWAEGPRSLEEYNSGCVSHQHYEQ